jgi:hypothetical protein
VAEFKGSLIIERVRAGQAAELREVLSSGGL